MNDNDSDIKNLNSKIEYTKEEKMKVQKNFFFLLIGLLIIIFICFIFLFYSDSIKDLFNNNNEEEIVEEKEEIDENALYNEKDGNLNINNEYVQELYSRLYLDFNEYFLFDSNQLYSKSISELSDQDKLFLISKTEKFHNLVDVDNAFYDKETLCSSPIYIDAKKIEEVAKDNFNLKELSHTDFTMTFVKENVFLSFMEFKYEEDRYVGNCIDYEVKPLSKVATSIMSTATKEKDYIYIDIKVIFQTENGIYKDIDLNTKISDTYNEEYELNYYASGSMYRIYYKYNDNNDYYLEKIALID